MQNTSNASLPDMGYIRQSELIKLIPISGATLWRKVKSGEFPAPIKLSERVTAWRVENVRAWMAECDLRSGGSHDA